MATLIPSFQSVSRRMTNGERRFAERLEARLEDDLPDHQARIDDDYFEDD